MQEFYIKEKMKEGRKEGTGKGRTEYYMELVVSRAKLTHMI